MQLGSNAVYFNNNIIFIKHRPSYPVTAADVSFIPVQEQVFQITKSNVRSSNEQIKLRPVPTVCCEQFGEIFLC